VQVRWIACDGFTGEISGLCPALLEEADARELAISAARTWARFLDKKQESFCVRKIAGSGKTDRFLQWFGANVLKFSRCSGDRCRDAGLFSRWQQQQRGVFGHRPGPLELRDIDDPKRAICRVVEDNPIARPRDDHDIVISARSVFYERDHRSSPSQMDLNICRGSGKRRREPSTLGDRARELVEMDAFGAFVDQRREVFRIDGARPPVPEDHRRRGPAAERFALPDKWDVEQGAARFLRGSTTSKQRHQEDAGTNDRACGHRVSVDGDDDQDQDEQSDDNPEHIQPDRLATRQFVVHHLCLRRKLIELGAVEAIAASARATSRPS
jgi:hypothetical protein